MNAEIEEIYAKYKEATGISTDTRDIKKGCFFVALKGNNFDGNKFAIEALDKGAKYALVSDSGLLVKASYRTRLIVVTNTLKTLGKLGNHHRALFNIPVIAIAGSNGKTTTKELVSDVLKCKYNIIKTEGNLNNHIGVPLTLLRIRKSTEIAVIEIGADKPNDIKELCIIVWPTHGVITNIGKEHLVNFISLEGVAKAEGELYKWIVNHQGHLFINSKDADLLKIIKSFDPRLESNITWYENHKTVVNKSLFGDFNLENMATAETIGLFFDIKKTSITKALKAYKPENMRSQRIETAKENEVILDAYNANPSSMIASLSSFARMRSKTAQWLILGDMNELGAESIMEHKKILDLVVKLRFTNVILIGKEFDKAHQTFKKYAVFKDKESCVKSFLLQTIKRSEIFIKGSNGMKLWELVEYV